MGEYFEFVRSLSLMGSYLVVSLISWIIVWITRRKILREFRVVSYHRKTRGMKENATPPPSYQELDFCNNEVPPPDYVTAIAEIPKNHLFPSYLTKNSRDDVLDNKCNFR